MTRVLLADDHSIVREGIKQILAKTDDLEVCGEAANGLEVMEQLRHAEIDIIILDMSMPGRSGIELIRQIKAEYPKLHILVLTMHAEEQYAVRVVRAGASGYLTKESVASQLVEAARKVARGGHYVSASIMERLAFADKSVGGADPHLRLSDREFEVFRLIVAGKSVSDMAEKLHLSVKTISTHKTRILEKMQLQSTADLVRYAIKHHLSDESVGPRD